MMMRRTTIPNSSFLIIKKAALQKECGSLHIAIKKASQKDAALVHSSRSVTIQAIIVVRRQGFSDTAHRDTAPPFLYDQKNTL